MRLELGLACVIALCACGSSEPLSPASDASDAVTSTADGPGDTARPELGAGGDSRLPADAIADAPAGQADAPDGASDAGKADGPGRSDSPADLASVDAARDYPNHLDGGIDSPRSMDGSVDGRPAGMECVELDECSCLAAVGCAPIVEACWCPTQCGVVCVCGGGRYFGCAPEALSTCAAAAARVARMCSNQVTGVEALCPSTGSECATHCLNQVTSCADVACATCKECKCAPDAFTRCLQDCTAQG